MTWRRILTLVLGLVLGLTLRYAWASPAITVTAAPNQSFAALLEQAQAEALAHGDRLFAADPTLQTLEFEVMARRGGNQAPLYRVRLSRSQAPVYELVSDSEVLLGFASTQMPTSPPETKTAASSVVTAAPPAGLGRWRYDASVGDFVENIDQFEGQYLHWTQFPVSVYIQDDSDDWASFVEQAMQEWSAYVPLRRVSAEAGADIRIYRAPTAVSYALGTASPEFYVDNRNTLQHRVDINLVAYQGLNQVLTVARHELGHALGLWGHSDETLDLMYSTLHAGHQILRVVPISPHSLNTLQRIYEQPTLIGQAVRQ